MKLFSFENNLIGDFKCSKIKMLNDNVNSKCFFIPKTFKLTCVLFNLSTFPDKI